MRWWALQHSDAHEADKPPPCGLDESAPTLGKRAAKVPETDQGRKNCLTSRQRKENLSQAQREEVRRERNAQRLEGQRREFERKCEARKKAEKEAAAAASSGVNGDDAIARAQTGNKGKPEEHSKLVKPRPRRLNEEARQAHPEQGQQPEPPGVENKIKPRKTKRAKGSRAAAKANDQKVNTEDDAAELLRPERGADADPSSLPITNGEERYVSPLMTDVRVSRPPLDYETDHNKNPSMM